jgi:hypothetical protein
MVSQSPVNPSVAEVIDLAAYRARRAEKPLPLFDGPPAPDHRPAPGPGTRIVVALSAQQAAHRTRMLRHLGGRARGGQDV